MHVLQGKTSKGASALPVEAILNELLVPQRLCAPYPLAVLPYLPDFLLTSAIWSPFIAGVFQTPTYPNRNCYSEQLLNLQLGLFQPCE